MRLFVIENAVKAKASGAGAPDPIRGTFSASQTP